MKQLGAILITMCCTCFALGQQDAAPKERLVPLNQTAIALDAAGNSALEASLTSSDIQGKPDVAVTNIRMVVKNSSQTSFAFVSGMVTFYDNAGVRCGEGVFKADMLASDESFETDSPGIRIRCSPVSWRIVASSLVPRMSNAITPTGALTRLVISIDGEPHPIQLGRPMTLNLANKAYTIVVKEGPQ